MLELLGVWVEHNFVLLSKHHGAIQYNRILPPSRKWAELLQIALAHVPQLLG